MQRVHAILAADTIPSKTLIRHMIVTLSRRKYIYVYTQQHNTLQNTANMGLFTITCKSYGKITVIAIYVV